VSFYEDTKYNLIPKEGKFIRISFRIVRYYWIITMKINLDDYLWVGFVGFNLKIR
jgi:hypothetical protein